MKSNTIELMQKSFVASLALSFVFAFATAAYLASPLSIRVQSAAAEESVTPEPVPSATPEVSFSNLNLITMIEASSTPVTASSSDAVAMIEPAREPAAPTATPKIPQTGSVFKRSLPVKQTAHPVRLIIPSIGLNAAIDPMGLNDKGEMDVPEGTSPNVGWYKHGTIPGNVGSAVIDAHVFAAFEELRNLKVGEEVIVENADGTRLSFTVDDSEVYRLGELSSGQLFSRRDARRLNLITCAGDPTADGSTYTHRLVVYTTLIG